MYLYESHNNAKRSKARIKVKDIKILLKRQLIDLELFKSIWAGGEGGGRVSGAGLEVEEESEEERKERARQVSQTPTLQSDARSHSLTLTLTLSLSLTDTHTHVYIDGHQPQGGRDGHLLSLFFFLLIFDSLLMYNNVGLFFPLPR